MDYKTKYNKINFRDNVWHKRKPETALWIVLLILGGYVMNLFIQWALM